MLYTSVGELGGEGVEKFDFLRSLPPSRSVSGARLNIQLYTTEVRYSHRSRGR